MANQIVQQSLLLQAEGKVLSALPVLYKRCSKCGKKITSKHGINTGYGSHCFDDEYKKIKNIVSNYLVNEYNIHN